MKLKLNRKLLESARAMIGLVSIEKDAIELINKLNGFEKELDIEEKYHNKNIDMLNHILGQYNHIYQTTLYVELHKTTSPYRHGYIKQKLDVIDLSATKRYIIRIEGAYSSLPYPSFMTEKLALQVIEAFTINGVRWYVTRNSPKQRWDDKDRPEYYTSEYTQYKENYEL